MEPISLIVPSFNGLELLKSLIPSILKWIDGVDSRELLVVDDGSQDGTETFLKNHFPKIKAIRLQKNMGFGKACNRGVDNAAHEWILILNNDVLLDSEALSKIVQPLSERGDESKKLFAITSKVLKVDKKTLYHGRNKGLFKNGEIVIKPLVDENGNTFFASGVLMAFRKEIFFELGGFDDLYHPFYWEDVDLCYRALKKGYHILYEPNIVIYHRDQGTIVYRKKGRLELFLAKMYARIVQERNQYLFTWKNILDKDLIREHIFWIPIHLVLSFKSKDHIFKSIGFLFALLRLRKALKKRRLEEKRTYVLKDRQVLNIVPT